jgi:acetaldehyde dehydrogenase (acetylating)
MVPESLRHPTFGHEETCFGVSIPHCRAGSGKIRPSREKRSPILAFYVEEGTQQVTASCLKVLSCGGLAHTARVHTRSRRAAVAFDQKIPVSRVIVNTSTIRAALDLSTALSPSLSLGCRTRGKNVTLDNVSPLHLMDRKRIAFETQPIEGVTPAPIDAAWA